MVYVYVYTSKQTTLKSKFHIPTKEFIYNLHYTCTPTPTCPNKIENKLSYSKKKYIHIILHYVHEIYLTCTRYHTISSL